MSVGKTGPVSVYWGYLKSTLLKHELLFNICKYVEDIVLDNGLDDVS